MECARRAAAGARTTASQRLAPMQQLRPAALPLLRGALLRSSPLCGGHFNNSVRTTGGAAAAAAVALTSADGQGGGSRVPQLTFQEILARGPSRQAPLPPPPQAATFVHVLPYLFKLAVSNKTMYWRVGAAFACLLVSKMAGMMCPLMIKNAVDSFTLHAGEPLAVVVGAATQFVLLYGLCDVTKNVAKELQAPLFTPVSQEAARRVSYHTFAHVLDLDVRFHLERRTGRLSRILERGMRSIQMLYRAAIFTFAPTALELAFVCGVLAKTFSPLVGGLVLATFAAYVTWSIIMTQLATDARKHVNELDNATSAKAVDALLSYETVTLFNNQALEVGQYNAYLKQYMKASVTTDRLSAVLNAGQAVVLAVGLTAIMTTALHTVGPSINPGDLVMIQGLLLQLWAPLQFLGWFYRELRSALVDMEDFFAILRTESNLVDGTQPLPPNPPPPSPRAASSASISHSGVAAAATPLATAAATQALNGHLSNGHSNGHANGNGVALGAHLNGGGGSSDRVHHWQGADEQQQEQQRLSGVEAGGVEAGQQQQAVGGGLLIELEDVQFGYSPDRQILKGLSLRVEPGKSLALVGPSGSGKSTVLRLLTRLYDTTSGTVRLNGQDVRDTQLKSLRDVVALVPQETMLFNDSIMQNIRYGRPAASDEEVVGAARLAHLHEAVMRMPKGYGTVVGERGLKLSGGEKQRVAIARAFLRQPRLLICDEATSALDSGTEAQIMKSLAELAVGRTSVFVAHRLSTIKDCDVVAVLKDGKLVEQGSHDELMALPGGLYRSMWESQAARKAKQQERRRQKAAQASMDHDAITTPSHTTSTSTTLSSSSSNNGTKVAAPALAGMAAAAAATTVGVNLGASLGSSDDDLSLSMPLLDPLQLPAPDEVLAAGLLDDPHPRVAAEVAVAGQGAGGPLQEPLQGLGHVVVVSEGEDGEEEDALSSVASVDFDDQDPVGLGAGAGVEQESARGAQQQRLAVAASEQTRTF